MEYYHPAREPSILMLGINLLKIVYIEKKSMRSTVHRNQWSQTISRNYCRDQSLWNSEISYWEVTVLDHWIRSVLRKVKAYKFPRLNIYSDVQDSCSQLGNDKSVYANALAYITDIYFPWEIIMYVSTVRQVHREYSQVSWPRGMLNMNASYFKNNLTITN